MPGNRTSPPLQLQARAKPKPPISAATRHRHVPSSSAGDSRHQGQGTRQRKQSPVTRQRELRGSDRRVRCLLHCPVEHTPSLFPSCAGSHGFLQSNTCLTAGGVGMPLLQLQRCGLVCRSWGSSGISRGRSQKRLTFMPGFPPSFSLLMLTGSEEDEQLWALHQLAHCIKQG